MPFSQDQADVIFAEDDEVFREITLPSLNRAGIPDSRIFEAEDGRTALDHLQSLQSGNPNEPIVMLLDVRMPRMDGIQCARMVQELDEKGQLWRLPYLVCCSSAVEQVSCNSGGFHVTMPKPFSDREMELVLVKSQEWWQSGGSIGAAARAVGSQVPKGPPAHTVGSQSSPAVNAVSGGRVPWHLSKVDMIVGGSEPICRMALITSLSMMGASEDRVQECETPEEVTSAVKELQATSGPLLVFLGNTQWISAVTSASAARRMPFVVSTSVDGKKHDAFDVILPAQFSKDDLQRAVEQYRLAYSS